MRKTPNKHLIAKMRGWRGRGSFSRDKKRYCGLGDTVPDTVSCLVLVLEEQEEQESVETSPNESGLCQVVIKSLVLRLTWREGEVLS